MDELEGVLEGDARQLSSDGLGYPDVASLERALELRVRMAARGREPMFARWILDRSGGRDQAMPRVRKQESEGQTAC